MSVSMFTTGAVDCFTASLGRKEEALLKRFSDPTTSLDMLDVIGKQLDRIIMLQGYAALVQTALSSDLPVYRALAITIYMYMLAPTDGSWKDVTSALKNVTDYSTALTDAIVKQKQAETALFISRGAETIKQEAEKTRRAVELANQESIRTGWEEAKKRQEEQNALQAVEETKRRAALAKQEQKRVELVEFEAHVKRGGAGTCECHKGARGRASRERASTDGARNCTKEA
ncbi:MAG: hypothetical protein LBI34_01260 [Puniceicoccales bacterium]|jgi:hypothetical protein|nr:hypothetical protein [Puniceicoccales bacterium]